jgi:redox-regulated HSP33 family molecular chaperone
MGICFETATMEFRATMQPEDVFREANEHIAEKGRELALQRPIPFLCECSDTRCFAHLFLSLDQYEEARANPQRYLTIAGHEVRGAMVVASDDCFALAEKI